MYKRKIFLDVAIQDMLSFVLPEVIRVQGKKGTRERSEAVTIRMTPEEKKNVYALAAAAGMTVTAYLIGCGIGDKLGQMVLDGFKGENEVSR